MTDLFPDAVSLSPRQAWLNRHGLVLTKLPSGKYEVALDECNKAKGEDADEACVEFCITHHLKHWLETDL